VAVLRYNPWNLDAESGDIMVGGGRAWRLYERRGGPKAAAGELCMRELKRKGMKATIKDGKLFWITSI
jgi:hypothetical protein